MNYTKSFILQITGILFALLSVSCGKDRGAIPVFDVNKDYPQKEFDYEANFNNVYIPIETDSIMIDAARVIYISDEMNILLSRNENKFIFIDKNGKIVKNFCRKGKGGDEYLSVQDAFYDPLQKEFFILDSKRERILILDDNGKYLRDFSVSKGHNISAIMNLNDNYFITYNCSLGMREDEHGSYSVMSKKDGSIIKDVVIQSEGKKRYPSVINLPQYISVIKTKNMIPGDDYVVLSESYCDTVYTINRKDLSLSPMFIKSPPFNTMPDNDKFFIEPCMDTPDYTLFVKLNVKYDESAANSQWEELVYDKKEKKFYKTSNKYPDEKKYGPFCRASYKSYGSLGYTRDIIELYKLQEQGFLTEPLKQILSGADENDNPVLVLMNVK